MWLNKAVIDAVTEQDVRVHYVDQTLAALWNKQRPADEPRLFTGFYWLNGAREGGPFKSRSSAWRDAWYRVVQRRAPPSVNGQLPRRSRI